MRYFLAIAEERSFTRAARRCHVAQASLSRQIRDMEVRLEARLFDRLPREIRLTDAGKIFEKEASKTLEHSRRAISLVHALEREKGQRLHIGLSSLCDLPRMRSLIETSRRSEGQIALECITAYSPELVLALHRGELDVAVIDLPFKSRGLGVFPICSEPLLAVLPHHHPLKQRPMIRLFELKKENVAFVSAEVDPGLVQVEAVLRTTGIEASSFIRSANVLELLDDVSLHRSIGLIRKSTGRILRDGVIYKPLSDSIQLETAIAWRAENRSSRLLSFRDTLITLGQRSSTT